MDSLNRHEDYGQQSLDETHLSDDPIKQFGEWLVEAVENAVYEPNAFVLSTMNKNNTPSSRTVLLKGMMLKALSFSLTPDTTRVLIRSLISLRA